MSGIRKSTRRAIYDYVREHDQVTSNGISAALDLSIPTVKKYVGHLMDEGLISRGAKIPSKSQGGRSPISYTCVPGGRCAVGVDITRETVHYLIVNLEREVVHRKTVDRTFELTESYSAAVAEDAAALIQSSGIDKDRILGVGIAMPGLVSEATESVTYGRALLNEGIAVTDFARHLPFRARLVHDSDAAGLAEFWHGREGGNAFYVSLSRSVGGSVLINGEIYRGDGEFAGEIGHVRIHTDGDLCYCGKRGCVDAYCNARVLARSASDGTLEGFFQELSEGRDEIAEVWDRYTSNLARAVNNVRVLFGCPVILGGDVGAHVGPHLAEIHTKVDDLSFLESPSESFLEACSYRDNPVATGAALYLIDEFREELGPPAARAVRSGESQ